VATVHDVMMEHKRIDELWEKVKYMLSKELSLYKAVSDTQATLDTFSHTKQEIGKIRWMSAKDAMYMSRKVLLYS
jgi:preprotein translocase subunit SecE